MECPELNNLEFDQESREAINRIRRMDDLADHLAMALTAGQLASIFTSRDALKVSRNISTSDWDTFAQAMRSVPDYAQVRLETLAADQVFRTANEEKWQQRDFWKAIYQGCQIDDS